MKLVLKLFTLSLMFQVSFAPHVSAEEPQGTIDWVNGFIVATGQGTASSKEPKTVARLKAMRVAEVSAQRALLEVIKGVRIDAQTTVRNMLLEEDIINSRVEGFLKGAIVTKRDVEFIDGAPLATVEMKVCMTGAAGECAAKPTLVGVLDIDQRKEPPYVPAQRFVLIVPPGVSNAAKQVASEQPEPPAIPSEPPPAPVGEQIQATAPEPSEPPPAGTPPPSLPTQSSAAPVPALNTVQQSSYDTSKPVTGVILNLEGRYFEREILPVVVTLDGNKSFKTVYSVKSVNPSIVRTYGAVRYADTLENARQLPTVGSNPLILQVYKVTKENMLVLRPEDAGILRETVCHGNNYLNDAKVVISIR